MKRKTHSGMRCCGKSEVTLPKLEKTPLNLEQSLCDGRQMRLSRGKRNSPVCSVETESPKSHFQLLKRSRTSRKVRFECDIYQAHGLVNRSGQSRQGTKHKGQHAERRHPCAMVSIESQGRPLRDVDMILRYFGNRLSPSPAIFPRLSKASESHDELGF